MANDKRQSRDNDASDFRGVAQLLLEGFHTLKTDIEERFLLLANDVHAIKTRMQGPEGDPQFGYGNRLTELEKFASDQKERNLLRDDARKRTQNFYNWMIGGLSTVLTAIIIYIVQKEIDH